VCWFGGERFWFLRQIPFIEELTFDELPSFETATAAPFFSCDGDKRKIPRSPFPDRTPPPPFVRRVGVAFHELLQRISLPLPSSLKNPPHSCIPGHEKFPFEVIGSFFPLFLPCGRLDFFSTESLAESAFPSFPGALSRSRNF